MNDSELILTPEGEIYHLRLKPGDLAPNIITVGDPQRLKLIEKYFDKVHVRAENREFSAITGSIGKCPLSVISTGIGADNIDIVFNEVDALFNIDFEKKEEKPELQSLNFFRLGTSGSIQNNIEVGDTLISKMAIGIDNLMLFYQNDEEEAHPELRSKIQDLTTARPYISSAANDILDHFKLIGHEGITFTANGFYGPQGRELRIPLSMPNYLKDLSKINYKGLQITNFEMETAAIYAMANVFGHKAISVNTILANRVHGTFLKDPQKYVEQMVENSIDIITANYS